MYSTRRVCVTRKAYECNSNKCLWIVNIVVMFVNFLNVLYNYLPLYTFIIVIITSTLAAVQILHILKYSTILFKVSFYCSAMPCRLLHDVSLSQWLSSW